MGVQILLTNLLLENNFIILDRRSHPRERIIEEVMGKYVEVTPIEKVSYTMLSCDSVHFKSSGTCSRDFHNTN